MVFLEMEALSYTNQQSQCTMHWRSSTR